MSAMGQTYHLAALMHLFRQRTCQRGNPVGVGGRRAALPPSKAPLGSFPGLPPFGSAALRADPLTRPSG